MLYGGVVGVSPLARHFGTLGFLQAAGVLLLMLPVVFAAAWAWHRLKVARPACGEPRAAVPGGRVRVRVPDPSLVTASRPALARRDPPRRPRGGRRQGLRPRACCARPGCRCRTASWSRRRFRDDEALDRAPARRWGGRSPCAPPRPRRTAPTRASPASTAPCSTSRGADAVRAAVARCRAATGAARRVRAGHGDGGRRRGRRARPAVRRAARRRRGLHAPPARSLGDAGRGARRAAATRWSRAWSPPTATRSTARRSRRARWRGRVPGPGRRWPRWPRSRSAPRRTSARRRTWSGRSAPRGRCCCSRGPSPWPRRRPWTRACGA